MATMLMISFKGKVSILGRMEQYIEGRLNRDLNMDKEYLFSQMVNR